MLDGQRIKRLRLRDWHPWKQLLGHGCLFMYFFFEEKIWNFNRDPTMTTTVTDQKYGDFTDAITMEPREIRHHFQIEPPSFQPETKLPRVGPSPRFQSKPLHPHQRVESALTWEKLGVVAIQNLPLQRRHGENRLQHQCVGTLAPRRIWRVAAALFGLFLSLRVWDSDCDLDLGLVDNIFWEREMSWDLDLGLVDNIFERERWVEIFGWRSSTAFFFFNTTPEENSRPLTEDLNQPASPTRCRIWRVGTRVLGFWFRLTLRVWDLGLRRGIWIL